MNTKLSTIILTLLSIVTFGHEGVELGPNKGRILEFSKNETMHGEVVAKDGKFRIAVLDKDMKPVALDQQVLTAMTGDRENPTKLEVTREGNQFVVPMQKGDDHWTLFQFKLTPKDKAITARLHYNAVPCAECKKPEWLCECKDEGGKK